MIFISKFNCSIDNYIYIVLIAVFIEAKSDTGKLRPGQLLFKQKYAVKECFWYLELRDIKQLDEFIYKNVKDFVNELPKQ